LHIGKQYAQYESAAESALALHGTTSPSFLILNSLDLCNAHIAEEKERGLTAFKAVHRLKKQLAPQYSLCKTDGLRITIDCNDYGYTGYRFAEILLESGVVCEMRDDKYIVLLFSCIIEPRNTERVSAALRRIPRRAAIESAGGAVSVAPKIAMSARSAYFSPKTTIPTAHAVGEVCAGVHVTIPPCVPLIMPGEIITREMSEVLGRRGLSTIDVVSSQLA
jgi:arginine/lysine/ornithine decarboxylase